MLMCLAFSFAGLYLYERIRSEHLEAQIAAITEPLMAEIDATKMSIRNQTARLQLLEQQLTEAEQTPGANTGDQLAGDLGPVYGVRRQLSNVRNLQLKIARDTAQLDELERELGRILEPRGR